MRPRQISHRVATAAGFTLVLLVASFLRLTHLDWDENQHLHPDERFLTMVMAAERWPRDVHEYLDEARSGLNPRNVGFENFVYGTLPTTFVKGASVWLGRDDYDQLVLAGRAASAIADLGTLVFLFLTARRLYGDRRVALAAALLYATAVLPIQHAHFFVVDLFATFFIAAAIWALSDPDRRGHGAFAAAGAFLGLALACKASVLTFGLIICAVAFQSARVDGWRRAWRPLADIVLAAMCAGLAFRFVQPDAFLGPGVFDLALSPRWQGSMLQASWLMSGEIDFPPGVQWADRTMLWFPLKNTVLWGLGPALGLAACAGTLAAAWRLTRGDARHLIPVLWIAVVFLHQGTQFVKAARYLLPIYPMLALTAAWLLVVILDVAGRGADRRTPRRWAARVLVVLVTAGTVVWAAAFTRIYRHPNTRVQASLWIYRNIPAGTALATEHWDDRLPLSIGDLRRERYAPIELPNYDEDTPEKLTALIDKLDGAAYLVLSSNRLYDSIPRLPMRYPMTVRYYDALFSGALGFDRVAEFTSYPGIGPFVFADQSAEEAFSVYDHARVQIFRKTARWDAGRARALLGNVDWQEVVRLRPRDAAYFKNGLLLTPEAWQAVRLGGTWSQIFDVSSLANRLPAVAWCLILELLAVLMFPLVALALPRLPDRGWLVAKALGLLAVAYGGWILASLRLAAFDRSTLVLVCLGLGAVSAWTAWARRESYLQLWREKRGLLLGGEVLFWCAFLAFLLIRSSNPDLWHPNFGGEKPMDFAFLNAVVRSEYFPPHDPWFAGGYINYYYFGFVVVAALTKLTGIVPQVAYNLAIPTFFALTAAGAFTVAHALGSAIAGSGTGADRVSSRRLWGPSACGLMSVLFVTTFGNLVELRLLVQAFLERAWTEWPHWLWYWTATRAIAHAPAEPPPITEFPFFTFLYGDLHAHMMALPITLATLTCAAAIVLPARETGARASGALYILTGFLLGTLYATNTWDYPTYVLVAASALALREWMDRPPGVGSGLLATRAGWRLLLIVGVGRVLFAPFHAHFSPAYGRLHLWTGSRTMPDDYFWIHGFFLFVLATWVGWQIATRWSFQRRRPSSVAPSLFLLALMGAGLLLTLAVEHVVIANDHGRMNTVFKLYFQVWVLWGVSAAVCAGLLAAGWPDRPSWLRRRRGRAASAAWAAVAAMLALACLSYPMIAPFARARDRFAPSAGFTLDGQRYMQKAVHTELDQPFALGPELDAFRWIQAELPGTPVVAEAHVPEYRWGARVSVNTGLPTILGWTTHQMQQRAVLPSEVVSRRRADVTAVYVDTDSVRVRTILDRYQADYVYVGALERIYYPGPGLEKFDSDPARWQRVYRNESVRIYRVVR